VRLPSPFCGRKCGTRSAAHPHNRLLRGKGVALLLDILKVVGAVLCGGLAGAFLTEWYRRKHGRLQRIPLIERVNRIVNPNLKGGITLARVIGDEPFRQLVELNKLREYQLTLRNTSTVHLQDVEIQFEFPAEDVQEYASPRTTLSKTALLKVDASPTDGTAFPTVFRWRIPHLPSDDSVEFTFQAENPASEKYVVALYNSERVIVEKVEGEPAPIKSPQNWKALLVILSAAGSLWLLLLAGARYGIIVVPGPVDSLTVVKEAGCDLRVLSSFARYEQDSNTRVIQHRIFNAGQSCVVSSDKLDPKGPITIGAGEAITRERLALSRPKLVQIEVSVGATGFTPKKTIIPLYSEP
jgi:hypothetical protein